MKHCATWNNEETRAPSLSETARPAPYPPVSAPTPPKGGVNLWGPATPDRYVNAR